VTFRIFPVLTKSFVSIFTLNFPPTDPQTLTFKPCVNFRLSCHNQSRHYLR